MKDFFEPPDVSKSQWGSGSSQLSPSKPLDYILILIVVRNSSNLGVLYDYLKGFGFRVLIANDGPSALSIVDYVIPDIILLDTKLPGEMDGFDVCQQLKARKNAKHIPVIFITGQTNTVDKVRGFTVGAVDYITKPFQSEEVLVRLKTHLTIQSLQIVLEEQNARLQEEIVEREKLIEELNAFSHTVAHDLKNPLAVIVTYAQYLEKFGTTMEPDALRKHAGIMFRNGRRMNNIIDELLLLSTVSQEDVETNPLEMGSIVTEVRDRLAFMIDEYQAKLVFPPDDEWPVVLGHGPWVEAVWTNYISNAIKYGGRPPQVTLGANVHPGGMVEFWVKDTGAGLTEEEQKRLFTPFTRLNQVSTEGHGLGLSIVQRIVEKLGGQVGVKNEGEPGQGCTFSFFLPQAR